MAVRRQLWQRLSTWHTLAPASDALCHRVTYVGQAGRYLDTVEPDQRLLAVTL